MDEEQKELGKVAYMAYWESVHIQGAEKGVPVPSFEMLPEGIQAAWGLAALAVRRKDEQKKTFLSLFGWRS